MASPPCGTTGHCQQPTRKRVLHQDDTATAPRPDSTLDAAPTNEQQQQQQQQQQHTDGARGNAEPERKRVRTRAAPAAVNEGAGREAEKVRMRRKMESLSFLFAAVILPTVDGVRESEDATGLDDEGCLLAEAALSEALPLLVPVVARRWPIDGAILVAEACVAGAMRLARRVAGAYRTDTDTRTRMLEGAVGRCSTRNPDAVRLVAEGALGFRFSDMPERAISASTKAAMVGWCIAGGSLAAAQSLVRVLDVKPTEGFGRRGDSSRISLRFIEACRRGHTATALFALRYFLVVGFQGTGILTHGAIAAAAAGHFDTVNALRQFGDQPKEGQLAYEEKLVVGQSTYETSEIQNFGRYAVALCCEEGHLDRAKAVRRLVHTKASEYGAPEAVAFAAASASGRLDALRWLHKCYGKQLLPAAKRAIKIACENGHVDVCQWIHETFSSPTISHIRVTKECVAPSGSPHTPPDECRKWTVRETPAPNGCVYRRYEAHAPKRTDDLYEAVPVTEVVVAACRNGNAEAAKWLARTAPWRCDWLAILSGALSAEESADVMPWIAEHVTSTGPALHGVCSECIANGALGGPAALAFVTEHIPRDELHSAIADTETAQRLCSRSSHDAIVALFSEFPDAMQQAFSTPESQQHLLYAVASDSKRARAADTFRFLVGALDIRRPTIAASACGRSVGWVDECVCRGHMHVAMELIEHYKLTSEETHMSRAALSQVGYHRRPLRVAVAVARHLGMGAFGVRTLADFVSSCASQGRYLIARWIALQYRLPPPPHAA
jgi:hypothetical protein